MASAATLTLTATPILTDGTWDTLGHSILVLALGWLLLAAMRLSSLLVSATVTETGTDSKKRKHAQLQAGQQA